jgi:transcriptional regulator with XRE-family HTH domain
MTLKKFNKSIIKRIDILRKQRGLSWGKLAYASGISKGGMSEIKNEKVEAKFSTLCKIALGLNMNPYDLLKFDLDLSEFDI